jgi:hypothetical protein
LAARSLRLWATGRLTPVTPGWALRDLYQQREQTFAQTMADRQQWEHATAGSRRMAIAADVELRRRHPDQTIGALRSAEPVPVSDPEGEELYLASDKKIAEVAASIRGLAAQRQAFRENIAKRRMLTIPSNDPDWSGLHEAFPSWNTPGRGAILQPQIPQILPSATILQLAAEHDIEPEAAD